MPATLCARRVGAQRFLSASAQNPSPIRWGTVGHSPCAWGHQPHCRYAGPAPNTALGRLDGLSPGEVPWRIRPCRTERLRVT
jgi:hypothetical protein